MVQNTKIDIAADPNELARRAAELVVASANGAVRDHGRFTLALSGGSTPRQLYQLLADPDAPFREQMPWTKTDFFWTDERAVPPDHQESNFRMASEAMLSGIGIAESRIHRMHGEESDVNRAATEYEVELRNSFQLGAGEVPHFDLVLLGLGADGHTASLFPGTLLLDENPRLVAAPWVPKMGTHRLTLTLPVLNGARRVVFLVSGEGKATVLREVLEGPYDPKRLPAQAVQPLDGELLWLADVAGARELH